MARHGRMFSLVGSRERGTLHTLCLLLPQVMNGTGPRRQFIPKAARLSSRAAFDCWGAPPSLMTKRRAGCSVAWGPIVASPKRTLTLQFGLHLMGERVSDHASMFSTVDGNPPAAWTVVRDRLAR